MENKTGAMIATIATTLCCGLPGCLSLCMGILFAFAGIVPGADIDIAGSNDPASAIGLGIAMLCGGIIFVIIPIATGFFTLRGRPGQMPNVIDSEPLPPAA